MTDTTAWRESYETLATELRRLEPEAMTPRQFLQMRESFLDSAEQSRQMFESMEAAHEKTCGDYQALVATLQGIIAGHEATIKHSNFLLRQSER